MNNNRKRSIAPIGGALIGALTVGTTFLGLWSVLSDRNANQNGGRGQNWQK